MRRWRWGCYILHPVHGAGGVPSTSYNTVDMVRPCDCASPEFFSQSWPHWASCNLSKAGFPGPARFPEVVSVQDPLCCKLEAPPAPQPPVHLSPSKAGGLPYVLYSVSGARWDFTACLAFYLWGQNGDLQAPCMVTQKPGVSLLHTWTVTISVQVAGWRRTRLNLN